MRKLMYLVLGLMIITSTQCVMPNPFSVIAPGKWRATIFLEGKKAERINQAKRDEQIQYEEVTEGELPFNFEVTYVNEDSFYIEILNGEERLLVDDISWGRVTSNGDDTIRIDFPVFDSYIKATYEANIMEGAWYEPARGPHYSIPFVARQGKGHRFTTLRKTPKMDISGNWKTVFTDSDGNYDAIAEFKQDGNYLTGTFKTETGDYRFLEGTVQDNKVYLSAFDGAHAFLFEAKILEDGSLTGAFWSDKNYKATWTAIKNDDFKLKSTDDLTYLKKGYDKIEFTFPDLDSNLVSFSDEKYKGKVRLVQILGTWCPNCMDETLFLADFYNNLDKKYQDKLAIIGLAYERRKSFKYAANNVRAMKEKFNVNYDVLIAGSSSKTEASKTLPMLNKIISYPTMIFIDKNNKVRRIHTGFNGPATSTYETFTAEFKTFVMELLDA